MIFKNGTIPKVEWKVQNMVIELTPRKLHGLWKLHPYCELTLGCWIVLLNMHKTYKSYEMMINGHNSNAEKMLEDDILSNSNIKAQNEIAIHTNTKKILEKSNNTKNTTFKRKKFNKEISPYKTCHSEQSEPDSKSPRSFDSFMHELDQEFVRFFDVVDGNNTITMEEDLKIVSCQESLNCIPNINDVINNIPTEQNNVTPKIFLQKSVCTDLPQNINKCIECHIVKFGNRAIDLDNIACRFCAFRLLQFNKSGNLEVSGYPDPNFDFSDMTIWLPDEHFSRNFSSVEVKMYMKILKDAGSLFCQFFAAEKEALNKVISRAQDNEKIAWKKTVNGVREMCDTCKTSLFNYHWFCGKCGFAVCIDCFAFNNSSEILKNYCHKKWLPCTNKDQHLPDKLCFAQIIAGNCLKKLLYDMHFICDVYNIPINCCCLMFEPDARPDLFRDSQNSTNVTNEDGNHNTNVKNQFSINDSDEHKLKCSIPSFLKEGKIHLDAPHMWLCEGALLRLLDPNCEANYKIFQDKWSIGYPVIISKVGCNLIPQLWHPESFSRDFGDQKNDIINCVSGRVISNQPMSKFWDGFEDVNKRMKNKKGEPVLLKLKDWPPSTDFAVMLPDRFKNLMDCLPLKEYTHRDGKFNLASHLPPCFVRPDLGPKMYTAYGFAGDKHENIGTTNLHLDMTDAVNVMVHVAITKNFKDYDYDWHMQRVIQLIKEAGCDHLTMKRIYEDNELPGALWHIYHATEADRIRDLLTQVAIEKNSPIGEFSDPIHDQNFYLDENLRRRLFLQYGIKGCTFVQFNGDAVFIPAGAPHQVRNLHNCIKVAEDFVSPENINHSYKMTQEFRCLSDDHTNHEDKLQVKNIVFHSIKDSVSILLNSYKHTVEQMS